MLRKVVEIGAVVVLAISLLGGVGYIVAKDALGLGSAEMHAAGGQGGGRWNEDSRVDEGLGVGEAVRGGGSGRGNGGIGRGVGEGSSGESLRDQGLSPEPQVPVGEWQVIEGMVVGFDPELMVATSAGETQVGLGPEWYRESQGVTISEGNRVLVTGFLEDGEFKAAELENVTTGELLILRDETGRPMWSGRGQRQGLSSKL